MKIISAAALLLFGFTNATTPARAPVVLGTGTPQVYLHDPYSNGASSGIPNVTGKGTNCTQSQAIGVYDDGGSVGVNCIDTYSGTSAPVTNSPAVPSGNQFTFFGFQVDAGFPTVVSTIDSANGIMTPAGIYAAFQQIGTAANWDVECVQSQGWATNTLIYYRHNPVVSTGGSVGSDSWATTSLLTRSKNNTYTQGITALNTNVGIKNSGQQAFWRGNAAGAGGFLLWERASIKTTGFHNRWAFGAFNTTSLLTGTADPDTATDSVYFGCNTGDANLSICSNDNSGTATCNTLGANFPCDTNGAWYDFWFYAPPGGSDIKYVIQRLDSAQSTGGIVSSDLPRNTVQMSWQFWGNTGDAGTPIALGFFGMCFAENY